MLRPASGANQGRTDVGLSIEAAAAEFGLHFVPPVEQDYFSVCLKRSSQHPAVQRLCGGTRRGAGDGGCVAVVARRTPGPGA